MSENRISELLQNKNIIDIDLISDSLSGILKEMIQMLIDQGKEIDFLKNEVPKFANKEELTEKIKADSEDLQKIKENLNNLNEENTKLCDSLSQKIQSNQESFNTQLDEIQKKFNSDSQQKYEELQEELKNANEQIKELQNALKEQKQNIDDNKQNVDRINEVLKKGEDETVVTIAQKLTALTEKVDKMENEYQNDQKSNVTNIDEIKNNFETHKDESNSEIQSLAKDLEELKRVVYEAPSIDVGEVTGSEALIREIQRDSRRIDGINETSNHLKEDTSEIADLVREIVDAFKDLQKNIIDFVASHNQNKKEIVQLTQDNAEQIQNLRRSCGACFNNIQSVLESASNSLNVTSDAFAQMHSILSKITDEPLPKLTNFDTIIVELQHLNDSVSAQNDNFENQSRIEDNKTPRKLPVETYVFPVIELRTLNQKKKRKYDEEKYIKKDDEEESSNNFADLELRQSVKEMQYKIDDSLTTVTHLRDTIDSKIDKKTDTAATEKMIDKLKGMISKLKEQVLTQNRNLMNCVQRNEAETIIHNILHSMNIFGETAAGSNHIECLACGRPRSTLAPTTLIPVIPKNQDPHELIYGKPKASISQSVNSTRSKLTVPSQVKSNLFK